MNEITRDTVMDVLTKRPRRRCFADFSGVYKLKERPSFSIDIESAKKIFEAQTGLVLAKGGRSDSFWRFISPEEIIFIEEWERKQGTLIFLRDCLAISVALDRNLISNTPGKYTAMGELEHNANNNRDPNAIKQLAFTVSQVIKQLPFYKDADLICAVPQKPGKDFDLPKSVAALVSAKVAKKDVTGGIVVKGQKYIIKKDTVVKRWDVWEEAQVSFQNSDEFNVHDKTVILIDDKYQSGSTIQYIAMKLQQAGAKEVYGLSFVKALGDSDRVVERA